MGWVASHIFIHTDDLTGTEGAVRELMLPRGAAADSPTDSRPPPVTLTPSLHGWVAVIGLSQWVDDLERAATALSRACNSKTIAAEVFGHIYRLRLSEHQAGAARHAVRSPEHGWDEDPAAQYRGPMPLYDDVEQRAYETLTGLGIPTELVLIGTRPFGKQGPPLTLGQGRRIVSAHAGQASQPVELGSPTVELAEAPVIPREVSETFGATLFEERYVEGTPSAATVDRLIEIEENIAARAQRAQPNLEVNLTITYHAGPYQQQLDELLHHKGRHVPPSPLRGRAPWWQFWRYFGLFGQRGR